MPMQGTQVPLSAGRGARRGPLCLSVSRGTQAAGLGVTRPTWAWHPPGGQGVPVRPAQSSASHSRTRGAARGHVLPVSAGKGRAPGGGQTPPPILSQPTAPNGREIKQDAPPAASGGFTQSRPGGRPGRFWRPDGLWPRPAFSLGPRTLTRSLDIYILEEGQPARPPELPAHGATGPGQHQGSEGARHARGPGPGASPGDAPSPLPSACPGVSGPFIHSGPGGEASSPRWSSPP